MSGKLKYIFLKLIQIKIFFTIPAEINRKNCPTVFIPAVNSQVEDDGFPLKRRIKTEQ